MIAAVASGLTLAACCALILLTAAGIVFTGPPRPGTELAMRPPSALAVYRPQPVGGLLPWTPPERPVPVLSPPRIAPRCGGPVAPNFWEWQ